MSKVRPKLPQIDIQFRLRTVHRPGFLARVFKEVGDIGGLIGDIRTVFVGKSHSVRDVTIAVHDTEHQRAIIEKLNTLSEVEVVSSQDVVFELHAGGKIHTGRSRDIRDLRDLRYYYTPGVARVCQEIYQNPQRAKDLTSIGNTIAIVTNGTRVLGLGDIGALASMPVMEGKAMIYDQFVGIGAVPILIDSKDKNEMIETVERIAPSFAGIHLEDIRVPDCFDIEDELVRRLQKPVMHDDQHGTATVCLAAILTSLRMLDRNSKKMKVCQIGLGAAGFGIARLLIDFGFDVVGVDPDPVAQKRLTDMGGSVAMLEDAMDQSDIVISTTGRVGLIQPQMIRKGHIVFALSNPAPEIDPDDALAAGAAFAADGALVNNALAYPGLFRAALNRDAKSISAAMKIAAAKTISGLAEHGELLPSIFHPELHKKIVKAVEVVC